MNLLHDDLSHIPTYYSTQPNILLAFIHEGDIAKSPSCTNHSVTKKKADNIFTMQISNYFRKMQLWSAVPKGMTMFIF